MGSIVRRRLPTTSENATLMDTDARGGVIKLWLGKMRHLLLKPV
jgi:hypothetical protein